MRKISVLSDFRNQLIGEERALKFSCPGLEYSPVGVGSENYQLFVVCIFSSFLVLNERTANNKNNPSQPVWVKKLKATNMLDQRQDDSRTLVSVKKRSKEEEAEAKEKHEKERCAKNYNTKTPKPN